MTVQATTVMTVQATTVTTAQTTTVTTVQATTVTTAQTAATTDIRGILDIQATQAIRVTQDATAIQGRQTITTDSTQRHRRHVHTGL